MFWFYKSYQGLISYVFGLVLINLIEKKHILKDVFWKQKMNYFNINSA